MTFFSTPLFQISVTLCLYLNQSFYEIIQHQPPKPKRRNRGGNLSRTPTTDFTCQNKFPYCLILFLGNLYKNHSERNISFWNMNAFKRRNPDGWFTKTHHAIDFDAPIVTIEEDILLFGTFFSRLSSGIQGFEPHGGGNVIFLRKVIPKLLLRYVRDTGRAKFKGFTT
jgi:hypothetical protein